MRTAMVGRLVASLSQRKVRLIRNGKVVMTYPIAIGQPAYPTPTGEYEINDKQVDPAWYPPDSPWAAELSTIPPGPGNPLGTRWIGTTAPAIGLHGTYADYSVGTAASHGCMRMHIPDVEELYDQVTIGMKISIRAVSAGAELVEVTDADWDARVLGRRRAGAGRLLGALVRALHRRSSRRSRDLAARYAGRLTVATLNVDEHPRSRRPLRRPLAADPDPVQGRRARRAHRRRREGRRASRRAVAAHLDPTEDRHARHLLPPGQRPAVRRHGAPSVARRASPSSRATARSWACAWTTRAWCCDLPGIIERLGLDPERVWSRLRADDDVMLGARAATWGGGGA